VIPVSQAHLFVSAVTHPGMKGKNNEDRYAVSAFRLSEGNPTPSLLAIIADGVGGHRAGEVAAEIAVDVISQVVSESNAQHPTQTLADAIILASQKIYAESGSDPSQHGMSTTCSCAWIIADRLYIASVGDTRIYLVKDNTIQQLTIDHTWVQEAIDNGTLTAEEARQHPNAHVIRRHLGSTQPVIPDIRLRLNPDEKDDQSESNQGLRLLPGDRIILCTDGLTDLVEEEKILEVLNSNDREQALYELIDLANNRGGHDNITIISLEVPSRKIVTAAKKRKPLWMVLILSLLGVGFLFSLGYLAMSNFLGAQTRSTPTSLPDPTFELGITSDPFLIPTIPPTQAPVIAATVTSDLATSIVSSQTAEISPLPDTSPTPIQATYTPWPTSTLLPTQESPSE
jgi:PPM family protein phosphatase